MPATPGFFPKYRDQRNVYIETGAYLGDSLGFALAAGFSRLYSIELYPKFYELCKHRFRNDPVTMIQGDSGDALAKLLPQITEPALFWLDAHTPIDKSLGRWCPALEEIAAIVANGVPGHTILVDDVRCLEGYGVPLKAIEMALPAHAVISYDTGTPTLVDDVMVIHL